MSLLRTRQVRAALILGMMGLAPARAVADELRKYFDYTQKLGGFEGKTLILHARHDELLPVRHAEMLYATAPEPKQLKIFDRGGHNDIFYRNQVEYMQLVEEFLDRV